MGLQSSSARRIAASCGSARHAEESDGVTQAEVVDLLRRNGAEAAAGYRTLTDEQLARCAAVQLSGHEASAEHLLAYLAIGEIENHGEHLRAAMSR